MAASRGVSPGSILPPGAFIFPPPNPRFLWMSRISLPRKIKQSTARSCGIQAAQSMSEMGVTGGAIREDYSFFISCSILAMHLGQMPWVKSEPVSV